jgi:hypothetical protein
VNFPGTIELWRKTSRLEGLRRNTGFGRFLLGDGLGTLGSIFYQVALPGLVMVATGSAAQVGAAILLTGAARIGLVLAGGALADRVSPLRLAAGGAFARAALLALLLWLAAVGEIGPLGIAALCLALGACDAVQIPARGAVVPRLVGQVGLLKVNGLLAAQEKALGLAGPALAGLVLSWAGRHDLPGYLVGFAIDAALLGAAGWLLATVRLVPPGPVPAWTTRGVEDRQAGSLLDLARTIWREKPLLGAVGMVLGVNALSVGPLCVGLPVLAYSRYADGAQALGLWMSAAGCGALAGTVIAGLLPPVHAGDVGRLAVPAVGLVLGSLVGLWLATGIWASAVAVFCLAAVSACANVAGTAQVQALTPREWMGKMMGILSLK